MAEHPTNKPKRPSMQDVADLAGVSRTTVSFVVNHKPDVRLPQATIDKVWAAIAELGYRPNALARSLRSRRTHTLGFISDAIATMPFAGDIIQGAQDEAWRHDHILLLVNTGHNREVEHSAVTRMVDQQVDGILYATMAHRHVELPPLLTTTHCVLLNCTSAETALPSIVPNEVQGGLDATRHLLGRGHTRIGLVGTGIESPAMDGRRTGYEQALREADIVPDPALMQLAGDGTHVDGYRHTLALMDLPQPPTALFCFNDLMAKGAYAALRQLGKCIPEDVAVVGFDNFTLISADMEPPLTTLALPHYEMGQWAVAHLLKQINATSVSAEGGEAVHHQAACRLIQRRST